MQENTLNALLSSTDIIFFSLDLDYCYVDFSTKHSLVMKKIWGVEIAQGLNMLECIKSKQDREKAKKHFDRAIQGEKFTIREEYGDNKLFRISWEDDYFPIYKNDTIVGVGVVVKDLSAQIEAQRAEIFQTLINLTKSGVVISDPSLNDNPLIFANDAFETITGYKREDVLGKNCRFLQGNDTQQEGIRVMRQAILNQKSCEVKVRNYKKDGTLFYNLVVLTPLFDEEGRLIYFAGFQNDITDLFLIQEQLKEQAYRDELTQTYNRKAFNEEMAKNIELFQRYNHHFCIAMLDIDNFKQVNDIYGHEMGDRVLIALSAHIKSMIRQSDTLFRIGGEEFVILFPETSLDASYNVMEMIRVSLSELQIIENKHITISAGVTEIENTDSKDSLYRRADTLMYHSKNSGKNITSKSEEKSLQKGLIWLQNI